MESNKSVQGNDERPWLTMRRTPNWYQMLPAVFCPTAEDIVKQSIVMYEEDSDGIKMKMDSVRMRKVKAGRVLKSEKRSGP